MSPRKNTQQPSALETWRRTNDADSLENIVCGGGGEGGGAYDWRLKPFQHNSWHLFIFNKSCFWGRNTSHIYISSSSTPFTFSLQCALDLKQQKGRTQSAWSRRSSPLGPIYCKMKWWPPDSNAHFNMAQASETRPKCVVAVEYQNQNHTI